jgi:hypothetical protein
MHVTAREPRDDGCARKARASTRRGTKASFEAGAPQALFKTHLAQGTANNVLEYDVTADGKRFLLVTKGVSAAPALVLTTMPNWDAGLKK